MSALIRTLHLLLLRDDAGLPGLAARGEMQEVGKNQPQFVAMATIGLCSWLSTFSLLAFLTYRFIFWQRYYKQPLARNQYVVLIYNLLADLQQATAFMISYHWIDKGVVQAPSAACVLQGWWIQIADPGSGLFVLAIAMHTGAVVLRGRQLEFRNFVLCIVALWCFILLLGFVPVGLFGSRTFVISESGWVSFHSSTSTSSMHSFPQEMNTDTSQCWLSVQYEAERVWVHYLWIFISEFGSIVLYGIMFFYLRYRMKQAATLRQNRDHLTRMNRVVIYMVIYPFVYIGLSLPLAAGRMCTANNIIPSKTYFAVAGSLMAFSGFVDVLVYTLTRKHLLVDTNMDAGSRSYAYYFNSNTYETHISTAAGATSTGKHGGASAGGGGGAVKKGNRFRRGLAMNRTTVDDGEGSTDEIVRKGDDWELGEMDRGVYQEVTFEITHEPAQQKEQQQQQQQRHEDEERREQHSSASEPSHLG